MNAPVTLEKLKAKDFATDQEVRWCPGCGDYAILKAVQQVMPDLDVPKENIVFISGIGCSSRFPYYMNTYGFHTIHGRAPAVATGAKIANPELDIWLVTGDGDSLSIGGNHLLHILRRNVDLQMLLFNNEIYGLTKGQYSPTSAPGSRSPSTPEGSVDNPVSPCSFALGAGGKFIARAIDTARVPLTEVLKRAHGHRGTSLVVIFQNCNVYNDGVFAHFTDRKTADETQIHVRHGEPLRFGEDGRKGLRLNPESIELEVIIPGEGNMTDADVLVHDERNRTIARLLAEMAAPDYPVALGVLYAEPAANYIEGLYGQREAVRNEKDAGRIDELLRRGHTWTVEA
jgi:2-oxoglutarate ferredoxin oxidoreductase subunit beta